MLKSVSQAIKTKLKAIAHNRYQSHLREVWSDDPQLFSYSNLPDGISADDHETQFAYFEYLADLEELERKQRRSHLTVIDGGLK